MASPDLVIKKGDTRDWVITLSDTDNTALDLTNTRVRFVMRRFEWHNSDLFARDTDGVGSDNIAISTPTTGGIVTITPTAADWTGLSDAEGVFVGEFRVSDQDNTNYQFTQDIYVRVDGAMF